MKKIHTPNELYDRLDEDFGWRKRELILLNSLLPSSRGTSPRQTAQEEMFVRSAIVLLYAHWEGFVKYAAGTYLFYVSSKGLPHGILAVNFLALSIRSIINDVTTTKKPSIHNQLVEFFVSGMPGTSQIPYDSVVDTQGNLNSELFREITYLIGVPYRPEYQTKEKLLDEGLLSKRNEIAHGGGAFLAIDSARYRELHDGIMEIIGYFFNDITNAAISEAYKRH